MAASASLPPGKISHFRHQSRFWDDFCLLQTLAKETGIPYQNLINLYLSECAHSGKKLTVQWAS